MKRRATWLLASSWVACARAGAPLPPTEPPVIETVPVASTEPADEEPVTGLVVALADPVPTDVPELAQVGCEVLAADATWISSPPVRVTAEGEPFGSVSVGPAMLQLAQAGPAGGARLAIERDGWVLRARLKPSDVRLAATAPRLRGVVVPKPNAKMNWEGPAQEDVAVALSLSSPIQGVDSQPVRWDHPCKELSLTAHEFDPRHALPESKPKGSAYLDSSGPIDLRSTPGGASAFRLENRDGALRVQVYERDAGLAQVLIDADYALLFGWLDSRHLSTSPQPSGVGFGTGHGHLGQRYRAVATFRCDFDVPLVVVIGAEPAAVVGRLRKGTSIPVYRTGAADGVSGVRPPPWFTPHGKATLGVLATDLERCKGT